MKHNDASAFADLFERIRADGADRYADFVVLRRTSDAFGEYLRRHAVLLDARERDRLFEEAPRIPLAYRPDDLVLPRAAKFAMRCSERIARRRASEMGVPEEIVRSALFYPLQAELYKLIPIRYLARRLAREYPDRPFVVPVAGPRFAVLDHWYSKDIEPFYLAAELKRLGASVVLLEEVKAGRRPAPGRRSWQFRLSGEWRSRQFGHILVGKGGQAIVPTGMRTVEAARRAIGECRPPVKERDHLLRKWGAKLRSRQLRPVMKVRLRPVATSSHCEICVISGGLPPLETSLVLLAGTIIRHEFESARRMVRREGVRHAHVCDHAFFDACLFAGAVVEAGGKISLWPHSANVVHPFLYPPEMLERVTVTTASTGKAWSAYVPSEKIFVDPTTVIPPNPRPVGDFDPDADIHIVLFAGAHLLARLPMFDLDAHRRLWRETLKELADLPDGFRVVLKPKTIWETKEWISALSSSPERLVFTETHANDLDLPNMVYLSVSLGSTALLEGLSRGIPCMIVRETAFEETPRYDPDFIPIAPPQVIRERIEQLRRPERWAALCQREGAWFEAETHWDEITRALRDRPAT